MGCMHKMSQFTQQWAKRSQATVIDDTMHATCCRPLGHWTGLAPSCYQFERSCKS